jgi:predicted TPR repeat methyltransferase
MDEQTVQKFWQNHPCGDVQVGGLHDRFRGDYEEFFSDYDRFRYQNERHLPACIESLDVAGKQVLEIGLGEGAESERLIRQGADWSGVDLTAESVASACKGACFSLGAFDAVQDLVGVLGPGEGARVLVPVVDVRADGVGELAD